MKMQLSHQSYGGRLQSVGCMDNATEISEPLVDSGRQFTYGWKFKVWRNKLCNVLKRDYLFLIAISSRCDTVVGVQMVRITMRNE